MPSLAVLNRLSQLFPKKNLLEPIVYNNLKSEIKHTPLWLYAKLSLSLQHVIKRKEYEEIYASKPIIDGLPIGSINHSNGAMPYQGTDYEW
ncbi:hypothetical protein HMPREF9969_0855 [Prevotella sp. oral taxon 306 str. F0472]|nr:hypothetical protein HMPREF9969_0855 [Prevotella sp. oral taxon 306 str. F0472]